MAVAGSVGERSGGGGAVGGEEDLVGGGAEVGIGESGGEVPEWGWERG